MIWTVLSYVAAAMIGMLAMAMLLGSRKQNHEDEYSHDTHRLDYIQLEGITVAFVEGEFGLVKNGRALGGRDPEVRMVIDQVRLTPSSFGKLYKGNKPA